MGKMQKLLLGIALSGAILAVAGFGTFALWSSEPVEVGGSVDNLVVKMSSEVTDINYEVDVGDKKLLAPGRTAIGSWVTLVNDSSETTQFNLGYQLQLLKDNEPVYSEKVSLEQYRSAAILANDRAADQFAAKELAKGLTEFLSSDECVTDCENMIEVGDDLNIGIASNDEKENHWLIKSLEVGEIDAILFPDSTFFPDSAFFPDGYFETASAKFFPDDYFHGGKDVPVLFPDTIFQLDKGENLHFLFATHLKEDTGNEYQGLTLDTQFEFVSTQAPEVIEPK